jgi:hypothetical protein
VNYYNQVKRKVGRPFGTIKNPVRHDSPVYQRWSGMKQRCLNPNSHIWKYYGGRGIKICGRWLGKNGFRNFYTDMGEPNGLILDRINNEGDYEPSNCRWATMKEQSTHRRRTGKKPDPTSLRQRSIVAGLDYHLVINRIRIGWSEERALTTPKLKRGAQLGHRNFREKSNS